MNVTITHNTAKNGIEVRFALKPDEIHREFLKSRRFRYSRAQHLWYMRYSVSLMRDVCAYFETGHEIYDGTATVAAPAIPDLTREDMGVEAAS